MRPPHREHRDGKLLQLFRRCLGLGQEGQGNQRVGGKEIECDGPVTRMRKDLTERSFCRDRQGGGNGWAVGRSRILLNAGPEQGW